MRSKSIFLVLLLAVLFIGCDTDFILIKQINLSDNRLQDNNVGDIPYEKKLKTPPAGNCFYWIISSNDDSCFGLFSKENELTRSVKN